MTREVMTRAALAASLILAASSLQPALAGDPRCAGVQDSRPTNAFEALCFTPPASTASDYTALGERINGWLKEQPEDAWTVAASARLTHARSFKSAEPVIQRALSLFRRHGDRVGEAFARIVLASQRRVYGRLDEAKSELTAAEAALGAEQDATVRAMISEVRTQLQMADGNYEAVITTALLAQQEPWFGQASALPRRDLLARLEEAFTLVGRYAEAMQTIELCLRICGGTPECQARTDADRADLLRRMELAGLVSRQEVVDATIRSYESGRRVGLAILWLEPLCRIGAYLEPDEAADWDRRCVAAARENHCDTFASSALERQAIWTIRRDRSKLNEALNQSDQALRHARVTGDPLELTSALSIGAELLMIAGDDRRAAERFQRAIDLDERFWSRSSSVEDRVDLLATVGIHYYLLGNLEAFGRGRSKEATARSFVTMERLRGYHSATELGRSEIDSGHDEALEAVRAEITALQRSLEQPESDSAARTLLDRLDTLELKEQEQILLRSRRDAHWAELNAPETTTVGDLQPLLAADEALLQFQLPPTGEADPWVNLVTAHDAESVPLQIENVAEFAQLLQGAIERRDGAERGDAARLGERLFGPPLARLDASVRRLIVVADGGMFALPLGLLSDPTSRLPLLARYELTVVSSATEWARRRKQDRAALPAAVLGLSEPSAASSVIRLAAKRGDRVASIGRPLPKSAQEIADLVEAIGGVSRSLSGREANEADLKRLDLSPFGVIHFATHAIANRSRPSRAAVVLAPGSVAEDGLLQPREIAKLQIAGKIVVLSACDSADGALIRGEGPLSLARAFLHAGASAVIGTLWSVRDDESAEFMRNFYRGVSAGVTVAAALTEAQRESMKNGAAPAAWAGYVLVGDGGARLSSPAAPPRAEARRDSGFSSKSWFGVAVVVLVVAWLATRHRGWFLDRD